MQQLENEINKQLNDMNLRHSPWAKKQLVFKKNKTKQFGFPPLNFTELDSQICNMSMDHFYTEVHVDSTFSLQEVRNTATPSPKGMIRIDHLQQTALW